MLAAILGIESLASSMNFPSFASSKTMKGIYGMTRGEPGRV